MRNIGLALLAAVILMVTGIRVEAATYVVKSGDTLSKIAQKYHTSVAKLKQENNIADINSIEKGQVLSIPNGKASKKAKVQMGFNADGTRYVTNGRETCEQVARKINVDPQRLRKELKLKSTSAKVPKYMEITVISSEPAEVAPKQQPKKIESANGNVLPAQSENYVQSGTIQSIPPAKLETQAAPAAQVEKKPVRELTWKERILQRLEETPAEPSKQPAAKEQPVEEKVLQPSEPQGDIPTPCVECDKDGNAFGDSKDISSGEGGYDWTAEPQDFSEGQNNNRKKWFLEPTAGAFVNISDGEKGIGATMFGGFAELAGWREKVHSDGRSKLGFSLGFDTIASYMHGQVRSSKYRWDEISAGGGPGFKHVGNYKGHQHQEVLKIRFLYETIDGKNPKSGYKMTQDSILLNPYFEEIWRFNPKLIGGFVAEGKVGLSKKIKSTWKDDKPSSRDMALGSLFLQKAFTDHWQGRGTVSGIYQGWNDGKGIELGAEARLNETYMFGVKANHIFSAKEGDSNGIIFYVRGEWGTPLRAVKPIAASQSSQEVK